MSHFSQVKLLANRMARAGMPSTAFVARGEPDAANDAAQAALFLHSVNDPWREREARRALEEQIHQQNLVGGLDAPA